MPTVFFAVFMTVQTSQNVTILAYLFIGQKGFVGELGERGTPGFDGIQGKKGESGNPGISGFAGKRPHSETFIINLTILNYYKQSLPGAGVDGQKGTPGNQGEKGSPGIPGADGHPGFPGFPGERGNMNDSLFFIELDDSCLLFPKLKYANTHRFPWLEGSLRIAWIEGTEGSSRTPRYLTLQ